MAAVFDRLRLPIGSVVVDIGLVMYLIYGAGQMTERFDAMDRRLASVEKSATDEKLAQRTAILEQRVVQIDRRADEILESLHRIENKLDAKADKR